MNKKSKGYILSIVLTILAVSLVGHELKSNGVNVNIFNKKHRFIPVQETKVEENSTTNMELSKEEEDALKTNPIGKKVKNNVNYPDKEKIQFKMFNAVDNFKTCTGKFIEETTAGNRGMECSFAVDVENKSSSSVVIDEGKKSITLIYHDNKRKVFDDNNKTYREFEEEQYKGSPTIVRPLTLFLHSDRMREDIDYLGTSNSIICADAVPTYLFIYEDWNYTESTFLGRNVYKLEGIINQHLSEIFEGKFSLIMDKETGIILQFLSFDGNGKVKDKLECTELKVNAPIDEKLYNKSTTGYVKK